jgi:hypothetical protein
MALANRKNTRRIFKKTGSDSLKMADDKIARISQSFASNVHIDAPETPDAAQAMIYALQSIEEDVEELHRHISSDDLAVNITGNAATATALTAGNKTLDGNLIIDTGHALITPFLNTNQISPPSGTDNDLIVISNGNIKFTLDSNTNETGQSFTFRNHTGMGNYTDMLTLDESGHFTLYGAAMGDPLIKLHQNTNTSTAGPPILEFFRNSSTFDNSNLGLISFKGRNSSGAEKTYAEISGISEETGTGTEGGKLEFKIASHDGEMVTGLKIEDGTREDDVDITIGSNSFTNTLMQGAITIGSSLIVPSFYSTTTATFQSTARFDSTIYFSNVYDTNLARTAAGELSINSSKIVTENHPGFQKHVLNCGWVGSTSVRQYLPFGYGGTSYNANPAGWSEFGAFIAPCNGTVDHVIIRSEAACGNSSVGIHIASNGTEMPTFNMGTFTTNTVNMSVDDTSYKFENFTDAGGTHNSFSAGDIIVVSFDPTGYPADSIATMVLNLDWTNTL